MQHRLTISNNWASGSAGTFDLKSLSSLMGRLRNPAIRRIWIRLQYQADTGTNKTPIKRIFEAIDKVILRDAAGPLVDLRGMSAHLAAQMELGAAYRLGAKLAASTNNQTGTAFLPLIFDPPKAARPGDFGIPVRTLLEGAEFSLQFRSATALGHAQDITTLDSITIDALCEIDEMASPEAPSRLVWRDHPVGKIDDNYPVNGRLRAAAYYGGLVLDRTGSGLAAQSYDSNDLGLVGVASTFLQERYREYGARAVGDPLGLAATAVVETEDQVTLGYAHPFAMPKDGQQTADLVKTDSLHIRTSGSITPSDDPRMVICAIEKRNRDLTARALGAQSVSQLEATFAKRGAVKTLTGSKRPERVDTDLAEFLPIKLK